MHAEPPILRDLRYPAIDGIRFYAALCVVVQHVLPELLFGTLGMDRGAFTPDSSSWLIKSLVYAQAGDHGVDVFFLISGFLMARIVLRPKFGYRRFLLDRFQRIYPAFFVSLVLATLADCMVFSYPWSAGEFAKNLVFLNAIPNAVAVPYNFVSWSLGYEAAFYLAIPILSLLALLTDRRLAAILLFCLAAALVPRIQFLALFLGAVIGSFEDDQLAKAARYIPLFGVLPLYLLINALGSLKLLSYEQYYPMLIALGAVLLIKIVWDTRHVLHRFFASAPMRFFGTLSYSIYLFHTIIASLVLRLLQKLDLVGEPSIFGAILYLVTTAAAIVLVSYASYRLIEQWYFRDRKGDAREPQPSRAHPPAQERAGVRAQ